MTAAPEQQQAVPDMATAALAYARQGLAVFPVWPALPAKHGTGFICGCGQLDCNSPAKHPIPRLAPRGLNDATTDEARVRHFWSCRPDANIGFATGPIIAIDIDPRHGGTLASFGEPLPPTWRAATGGGGLHLFFQANGEIRNSVGKLAVGVDVRGVGGYTILPPSLHISGQRYSWTPGCAPDQLLLALLPAAVATALAAAEEKGPLSATAWHELVAADVAEGARNQTITGLAGYLLRHYVDPRVVLELLLAWNATRCTPPLPLREIASTVNSIAKKELQRRSAR
jgi:hypothetical protein